MSEKYPEHEKLKAREADSRLLSAFYDFIVHDQCWTIAEYGHDDFEGDQLWPIRQRPDEIIGLFLGIDPKNLEAEKRAMLEEIRKADDSPKTQRTASRAGKGRWGMNEIRAGWVNPKLEGGCQQCSRPCNTVARIDLQNYIVRLCPSCLELLSMVIKRLRADTLPSEHDNES